MNPQLEALLARIDTDVTHDGIARRVDAAINTITVPDKPVRDWYAFRECVLTFFQRAERSILGIALSHGADEGFDWGRCLPVLNRAFGRNGEKAAFELARTGVEGGLYRVLRELARTLVAEFSSRSIAAWVWAYWNALPVAMQLSIPDEYLEEFGHLLPAELTEDGAARIRANFPQFLIEHPGLIRRLRQVTRRY